MMNEKMTIRQDNVDPAEISKFNELASRWWDPEGEFKPLHQMNPVRLDYIDRRAPLAGKRCLDIGCGGGILSEAMAATAASVTGIDFAGAALEVARLHLRVSDLDNVRYLETSADALADTEPASYDVVTCLEVLEHGSMVVAELDGPVHEHRAKPRGVIDGQLHPRITLEGRWPGMASYSVRDEPPTAGLARCCCP